MFKNIKTLNYYVGNLCNSKCLYCYVNAKYISCKKGATQYKLKADMINTLYEKGIRAVNFTGGEPFVYEDIWGLMKSFKKSGYYIKVSTNGINVSKEDLDIYDGLIDQFNLSLDGVSKVHDFNRGIKGSYEGNMKLISLLNDRNIPFVIQSVITNIDYDNIKDLIKLCSCIKAKRLKIVPALRIGRGEKLENFSDDQISNLFKYVNEILEQINYSLSINFDINKREEYYEGLLGNGVPSLWYNADINNMFLSNHYNERYRIGLNLNEIECNNYIKLWKLDYKKIAEDEARKKKYFNIYEELDKLSKFERIGCKGDFKM